MKDFEVVYERFLSLVTEYDYINYTQEELEMELEKKLEIAFSKLTKLNDLEMNLNAQRFSRDLTQLEVTILAQALLTEWLSVKVFNVKLMENHLSSKDFTVFSNANHLKEMVALQEYSDSKVDYMMKQYTFELFKKALS